MRGHRVIPDPEEDTPPTEKEGLSLSEKMARGEGDDNGHARGKRGPVEEQGAGGRNVGAQARQPQTGANDRVAERVGPPPLPSPSRPPCPLHVADQPRHFPRPRTPEPSPAPSTQDARQNAAAGAAPNPSPLATGRQGRETRGQKWRRTDGGRCWGGCSRGWTWMVPVNGEKAQGADAEGAAAEGRVVLKGAGDKAMARHGAEGRGSVQGYKIRSSAHKE